MDRLAASAGRTVGSSFDDVLLPLVVHAYRLELGVLDKRDKLASYRRLLIWRAAAPLGAPLLCC